MQRQLTLIDPEIEWRIDDRTREVGRQGLAKARAALAAAHLDHSAPPAQPLPGRHRPAA